MSGPERPNESRRRSRTYRGLMLLEVETSQDDVDLASDWLWALGATAIEVRESNERGAGAQTLVAGFADGDAALAARSVLIERWPTRFEQPPDEAGWRDVWLHHLKPISVGSFLIHPPWIEPPPHDANTPLTPLSVDPGRTFGSGHHPTTRLVIERLAAIVRPGDTVLDVGCGSGVVGIAAAALGAAEVVAIDVEPAILETARANAEANGLVDRFQFVAEPFPTPQLNSPGEGDVVVANIVVGDLQLLLGQLAAATSRDLVISGFLTDQTDQVEQQLSNRALRTTTLSRSHLDGWAALHLHVMD